METYAEYVRRIEGLPNPTILTEAEWKEQTRPKGASLPGTTQTTTARSKQFSAAELTHMEVIAAQALEADRLRARSSSDSGPAGLTAVQNAEKVRESVEEAFRHLQYLQAEDKKQSEQKQAELEKELADAEHAREMAAKALESDALNSQKATV